MNLHNSLILIVDDDVNNLQVLFKTLQDARYEILIAKDATSALARLQHSTPDLILLDIMLPGMDGLAFYRHLRQELKSDVPVIFLTAVTDVNTIVTGLQLNAVDYITKPFDPRIVIARVEKHLQLERLRRELRHKNDQLQNEVAELDAFAHTVAHDLKSPLAIVMGFTEMLNHELSGYPSPRVHESLKHLNTVSRKMAGIIDELLLLAQIHRQTVSPQEIDMCQVVQEALLSLESPIKTMQAIIRLPETWLPARGYAPWVEIVWLNYLNNGLKYGGCPPTLTLGSTQQQNNQIRFWITDNGSGVPLEMQATLFTEFTRVGKKREPGHGLGLSIVRRIITRLGGEVGLESQPGQGSTFYFTLPAVD